MDNNTLNLFWAQPCAGLPDNWVKESSAVLLAKEKELGLQLPVLYKQLMMQQNGGNVRLKTYFDGKDYHQLFGGGCDLSPIAEVTNYKDFLHSIHAHAYVTEEMKLFEFCFPDRMVLMSDLDGHSLLCLDYGWLKQHADNDPAVVIFEQSVNVNTAENAFGYAEASRIASFDKWCNGLVYYGYECEAFFLGISSTLSIDELAKNVEAITESTLKLKTDNRYGWFNFDRYYAGMVDTDDQEIRHQVVLSPNTFLSGTHRFQHRPNTDFILEVEPIKNKVSSIPMDISTSLKNLALELESKAECRVEPLLYPHPFLPAS